MRIQKVTMDVSKKENVVLFGNGICRCIGMNSCDDIIEQIRKENNPDVDPEIMNKLQFPQKIVVATGDRVDENMKRLTKDMIDTVYTQEDMHFLKELVMKSPTVILTANYSTELERAAYGKFTRYTYNKNLTKVSDLRNSAEDLGLNKYIALMMGETEKQLWHIHGNAMKPKSIVMGHYYYGKLLREIQEYIPNFMRRYHNAKHSNRHIMQVKSWVDYFMINDIHILGFSMDLAEVDLWWLLCCKKRHFPDSKIYFYEPNGKSIFNSEKELLMKAYGVEIRTEEDFKGNYKDFYRNSIPTSE